MSRLGKHRSLSLSPLSCLLFFFCFSNGLEAACATSRHKFPTPGTAGRPMRINPANFTGVFVWVPGLSVWLSMDQLDGAAPRKRISKQSTRLSACTLDSAFIFLLSCSCYGFGGVNLLSFSPHHLLLLLLFCRFYHYSCYRCCSYSSACWKHRPSPGPKAIPRESGTLKKNVSVQTGGRPA